MPIIQSSKKRARQAKVREARNKISKRKVKEAIKELLADAKEGGKNAGELFKKVQSTIDTAVKKNLIHKNTAARKKSRLNAALKAAGVNPQGAKSAAKKASAPKTATKKVVASKKPAAKPAAKKATTKATKKASAKK